jgi:uncharacterized protein YceH (UPF0502 family)
VPTLTANECRVLGALIEKQITTPEYYPLTLNSLTLACNQKNNRNPVTSFSEGEVEQALDSLREKNLAYVFYGSTSRVPKYKHVADNLHLTAAELAAITVLMLSGAQTVGEIRTRGTRLHEFSGLEEVEQALHSLSTQDPDPMVIKLPRQPGQKEARFAHLLAGEVNLEQLMEEPATSKTAQRLSRANDSERIAGLEARVETLSAEIENLGRQFEEFRKQFE